MKKVFKIISLILTVLTVSASVFAVSFAAEDKSTSTSYRYDNRFGTALLAYNDLSVISEVWYAIPGLENTELIDDSCSCMTPQGLCVTEDYIFISAYCNINNYKSDLEENKDFGGNADKLSLEENHKTHNSVIYVLGKENGAYLKTLVLPDTNHVGGLTYDGINIIVAKSTDKQISVITSEQIDKALAAKSATVAVDYNITVDCGSVASFVTYYDGILWVGVFNENASGELNGFTITPETYELTETVSVSIPEKANGACFTELNGEICLAVNSSYGRKNVSKIYLYSVSDYAGEEMNLNEKDIYTVPPTVQNSCVSDGKVYYIFESAATCYSQVESLFEIKSTTCPIDRVCIGEAENLFNWHSENFFFARISAFVRAIKTAVSNIF